MSEPNGNERLQTLVRRFQQIAEGDLEVVGAVTLLAELPGGEELVALYDEVMDAAIEAGIDDIFDLLVSESTQHGDDGDCSNDDDD